MKHASLRKWILEGYLDIIDGWNHLCLQCGQANAQWSQVVQQNTSSPKEKSMHHSNHKQFLKTSKPQTLSPSTQAPEAPLRPHGSSRLLPTLSWRFDHHLPRWLREDGWPTKTHWVLVGFGYHDVSTFSRLIWGILRSLLLVYESLCTENSNG